MTTHTYTIRVELHDAEDDDYDKLHKQMKKGGFYQHIIQNDIKYRLPTAEYSKAQTELTPDEILAKVKSATKIAYPNPKKETSILITETKIARIHSGLEVIE